MRGAWMRSNAWVSSEVRAPGARSQCPAAGASSEGWRTPRAELS
jgi:hypothetical protein